MLLGAPNTILFLSNLLISDCNFRENPYRLVDMSVVTKFNVYACSTHSGL